MPRVVNDKNLGTRAARARFKPSGKPYWRAVDIGCHVGYRKNEHGGRWVARLYLGGQRYAVETLDGVADDGTDADGHSVLSFAQAQKKVRELYVQRRREAAGLPSHRSGPFTVRHACEAYIEAITPTHKALADARHRANRIIEGLGDVECSKLTHAILEKWHHELASARPRARTKEGAKQNHRPFDPSNDDHLRRRRNTANRILAVAKAALNRSWRKGLIADDTAWRRLAPFRAVSAARPHWLTIAQAKRLVNACRGDFRQLVMGALLTGGRYGELRALKVSDFDPDHGTLFIRTSKSGKPRDIVLNAEGIQFFSQLTAGRAADEWMFVKSNSRQWGAGHQVQPMAEAVKAARLDKVTFHALRHSYASLSVMAKMPMLILAQNLGHASVAMLESNYAHLSRDYVRTEIQSKAPTFGFERSAKVRRLK
jgi:integrase